MAAASNILINIMGADKTGAAFDSVASKAKGVMGKLAKVAAIAGVATAVYKVGKAAIVGSKELGLLSDQAQQAGIAVPELQKLVGALGQVGIQGMDAAGTITAFSKMTKETGETGIEGFKKVLSGIASMNSEQERATELQKVFGRQGLAMAPLVRQGPDALIKGLEGVMGAYPSVSQSAAEAGDRASDAMAKAGDTIHNIWLETVGKIITKIETAFGTDIGVVIMNGIAWFQYFAVTTWNTIYAAFKQIQAVFVAVFDFIGQIIGVFLNDWRQGVKMIWEVWSAYITGLWDIFKLVFAAIKDVAISLGKNLWKWLKGDETDFGEIGDIFGKAMEGVKDRAKEASQDIKDIFKKNGVEMPKIEIFSAEEANQRELDKLQQKIRENSQDAKNQALLATGSVPEDGDNEKKETKSTGKAEEKKFGELILGNSYDAFKAVFSSKGMGQGGNSSQTSTSPQAKAASAASATVDNTREMINLLRALLVPANATASSLASLGVI